MPVESKLFRNKEKAMAVVDHYGQFGYSESTYPSDGDFQMTDACPFIFCTGYNGNGAPTNTVGYTGLPGGPGAYASPAIADISNAATTTTVNLVPAYKCPLGMRPYLTRLDIDVQGAVNWGITSPTTGIPYLAITDTSTLPNPFVVVPFNALKGITELTFPDTETTIPILLGPSTVAGPVGAPVCTATFAAATGLLTAAQAIFPNSTTCMVGTPVSIIDGTGKGQTAQVQTSASNSTTVLALGVGAFPTAPDSTSVFAIWWQPLVTYGSTTSLTIPNYSTNFTANAFDNGYNAVGIFGSGVGSSRPISASSTAGVLTLAYALNNAMSASATLATLSMLQITTDNQLCGAIDMCIGDKWNSAAANTGINCVVNPQGGTSPVGSVVRIYGEGYWAF